jgi:16S rRNA (cytidine1402-2'-O)-methyltransferase
VVATPIGNLEDITLRAVRVLREVDLIAAEDTRAARVLLSRYEITTPTVSYFKGNEARREPLLLERLKEGQAVALISEAGTPGVSDPGHRLIERCLAEGLAVDVIPGPSAVLTALLLSGLPTDCFSSFGFLPRRGRDRKQHLEELRQAPGTLILYEAPGRVARTLADLLETLGDRPAALVREMTKLHQEAVRASLSELAHRFAEAPPRGEVTLVVAPGDRSGPAAVGSGAGAGPSVEDLETLVRARLEAGSSPRAISRDLAPHGRRRVYQMALGITRGQGGNR